MFCTYFCLCQYHSSSVLVFLLILQVFSLNIISKKFSWQSCHNQFSLLFSITEINYSFIKPILNNKFPHLFDYTSSWSPTTVEVLFILSSVSKTICATLRIRNKQVISCWLNRSMEKLLIPGVSGTVIVKPQANTTLQGNMPCSTPLRLSVPS